MKIAHEELFLYIIIYFCIIYMLKLYYYIRGGLETMKIIILIIITFTFALDTILSTLNYRYRNSKIPKEVEDVYDFNAYKKWQQYYMESFRLSIICSTLSFIIIVGLLAFNVFPNIYAFATDLTINLHLHAIILLGFYFVIEKILGIIISYYNQFIIEERYGFNKTTIKTFIIDNIKSLILTIVLGGGAIYGLSVLYKYYDNLFYIYARIAIIATMMFINLFYVKLFVPLFNKLRPLEEGELKENIENLAHNVGYEVRKISVMDASRRSTKLNAFFSGFGKFKHIVLFDTLIEKMTPKQILSVLAHEIGHAKKRHTLKNLMFSIISISIFLLILLLCVKDDSISIAFGFEKANFGFGMLIFLLLLSPISIIVDTVLTPISRKFEYEADYYASINTNKEDMVEALKIIARENFANLTPHPFYVKLKYSHPPISDRI